MPYIPSCGMLARWLDAQPVAEDGRLILPYDDVIDVLTAFIAAVPIDASWYRAEYQAVTDYIARNPGETAQSHFAKHGYFEGRRPFAPGWQGYRDPISFGQIKPLLRLTQRRGHLYAKMTRADVLDLIRRLLEAVPVDVRWYTGTYPGVAVDVTAPDADRQASDHYATMGYLAGYLPTDVEVDQSWYLSHYSQAKASLEKGLAADAKDHFLKLGYRAGCRPTPP